jgi:hypothetical protein
VSGSTYGIYSFASIAGATARVSVTRSTLVNNVYGIIVDSGAGIQVATMSNNLVTGNSQNGFYRSVGSGTSTLNSLGNNTLDQNGAGNTSGVITPISGF